MKVKKASKIMDLALKGALLGCLALGASAGAMGASAGAMGASAGAMGASAGVKMSSVQEAVVADKKPITQTLAKGEAYLLVNMQARSSRASFSLNSDKNKLALRIRPQNEMQLIKVKAGTYTAKVPGTQRRGEIRIAAGSVTYIGDWKLEGKQKFMINGVAHTTGKQSLRVAYDVDNLFAFAEENPWIKRYPLHVSGTKGKRVSNRWIQASQQTAANIQPASTVRTTDS